MFATLFQAPHDAVAQLVDNGGSAVFVIFCVGIVMWGLIFERIWFFRFQYPKLQVDALMAWRERQDHSSWAAQQIRKAHISRLNSAMSTSLPLLKIMVPMCPLIGLIGTVAGMLEVFSAMTIMGTADAGSLASGVSKALNCTMTGLAVSISGMFPVYYYRRVLKRKAEKLSDLFHSWEVDKGRGGGRFVGPEAVEEEGSHGIDLAPMLDFTLNLLIFFIITAAFTKQLGLPVSRPPPNNQHQQQSEQSTLVIGVHDNGAITIKGRAVDPSVVLANVERYHALNPSKPVIVAAQDKAPTGVVVEVMDKARQAGVANVSIAQAD